MIAVPSDLRPTIVLVLVVPGSKYKSAVRHLIDKRTAAMQAGPPS